MKKSVKIAICCFVGLMVINGCTHTFNNDTKPQTQVTQQVNHKQIKDVIVEQVDKFSNGYTLKYNVLGDKFDPKETYYNCDKKITNPSAELGTAQLYDSNGNIVSNYIEDRYSTMKGGNTYIIDGPVCVEENLGFYFADEKNIVLEFNCDVNSATCIEVECQGWVTNQSTGKPVAILNVISTME